MQRRHKSVRTLEPGIVFTKEAGDLREFVVAEVLATRYGGVAVRTTDGETQEFGYWAEVVVSTLPVPGMGATLHYPQDSYGMVVTHSTPSGKTIHLQRLKSPEGLPGQEPAYYNGPWPVWEKRYTDEERTDVEWWNGHVVGHLRKDGYYYVGGTRIVLDYAAYRRDYSL